ncbi:peptidoglycan DD-metalloendopeptidase family protein [Enterococcus dongliensis]|uniref:Peptidoglycan DD-metalloendopeptidase family protein n=1 Tax=Enterococcus dongliensis TaxID=2559925 RepID=A0ABU3ES86_9ENTE|nr:peptidoglycan DD-metalloendopeptidase family protein [Enterococcus dongliensis]MDT2597729.1 peptidoglycan DD-metalloendopeptidase family protein [Enterococcus dongliensis]
MNKKIIFVSSLMLSLLINRSIIASAQTIDEKIQDKSGRIENIINKQKSAKSNLTDLNNQIEQLEKEYQVVLNDKNNTEKKLNSLRTNISNLEKKITRRNDQIVKQARSVQTNQGRDSIVSILFNSESLSDVVNTTVGMTKLLNANNETMQVQIEEKKNLETLKNTEEKKLKEAEEKTQSLGEKEVALANAKLEQNVQINEISSNLATETSEKEKFENQKIEAEKKKEEELKALEEEKRKQTEAELIIKAQEAEALRKAQDAENNKKQQSTEILEKVETEENDAKVNETKQEESITLEEEKTESEAKNQETEHNSEESFVPVPPIQQNETPTPLDDTKSEQTVDSSKEQTVTDVNDPSKESSWRAPVSNIIVTSPFGNRYDPTGFSGTFHSGLDMGGTSSTPIMASKAGTVVQSSFDGSAGNYIIIDHGDGYYSYYLHMSSFVASVGQSVSAGQTIGIMGTTGNSTGVHLHFSISTSPNWTGFIDPAPLLGV